MEVDSKLPKEIAEKCEAFSEHVKKMEEQLEKISNISMKDRNALSPLDRAKIDLGKHILDKNAPLAVCATSSSIKMASVSVYSINSLAWLYHIVNGSNPKESQIPGELTRIQASMKKVKGNESLLKCVLVGFSSSVLNQHCTANFVI